MALNSTGSFSSLLLFLVLNCWKQLFGTLRTVFGASISRGRQRSCLSRRTIICHITTKGAASAENFGGILTASCIFYHLFVSILKHH